MEKNELLFALTQLERSAAALRTKVAKMNEIDPKRFMPQERLIIWTGIMIEPFDDATGLLDVEKMMKINAKEWEL